MSQLPFLRKVWQGLRRWVVGSMSQDQNDFLLKEKESLLYPQLPSRWYLETQATQGSLWSGNWKYLFPHQLADGPGLGPGSAPTRAEPPPRACLSDA